MGNPLEEIINNLINSTKCGNFGQRKDEKGEAPEVFDETKKTILVIDDDPAVRQGFYYRFKEKYNVVMVESGEEGLKKLKELSQRDKEVHTVILDIVMPGMDGYKTNEEIKKHDPKIPVIFLTAYPKNRPLEEVLRMHSPWSFLEKGKDIDNEQIDEIIEKAVNYYAGILKEREEIRKICSEMSRPENKQGKRRDNRYDLPIIIGGKKIEINYDENRIMPIKDFNSSEILGVVPDITEEELNNAITKSKESFKEFRKVDVKKRIELLNLAGKILSYDEQGIDNFDEIIPRTNLCSRKIVVDDRMSVAKWMMRTEEYLEKIVGREAIERNLIRGEGTVGIFVQSSMYQTAAYAIIEAIRAGNSIVVKLDSKDPYPAYQVCMSIIKAWEIMRKKGELKGIAPINVVAWDTVKKPWFGKKLMAEMDKNVFMGRQERLIMLQHGIMLKRMHLVGEKVEKLYEIMSEQRPFDNVLSYVSHLGAGYVHKDADIDHAADMILHSTISHYRSCKRLITAVVHPEKYNLFLEKLIKKADSLVVGDTKSNVDIVEVNKNYWEKIVSYLNTAERIGKIAYGKDISRQGLKIVELGEWSKIENDAELSGYLKKECMFPVLNVVCGDENVARIVVEKMGKGQYHNRILEFSIFTEDRGFFEREFVNSVIYTGKDNSWAYHMNEPTTWGLGNVFSKEFIPRTHERKRLVLELSRTMPSEKKTTR